MRRGWLAGLLALLIAAPAAAQVARQDVTVQGLDHPADIVVDQWGIPHIFAGDARDGLFLQGWNAARDRLWQIDLWRKRGLGLLSASFGPAYVAQDRAARLFLYRGDMAAEWAAYGPNGRHFAEAFTAGVNAYVTMVREGRAPLPLEFKLTHSEPDFWSPEDVVRIRSHALTRNADSEVARARVACAAGLPADALRRKIEPPHALSLPAGLDPCAIPADVLADYVLGTKEVSFQPLAPAGVAAADPQQALADRATEAANEGSNNWVVAPSRTATGRPILANDPHRTLGVPSLRYIVQVTAPGLSFIGAGEPEQPGVTLGHNDRIAFGITIFPIDQEDLYVYELNPANPRQYRYQGRWEDMRVVHETLAVKGEPPRDVELDFTRHGPVLKIDPTTHRAFALRTVWSEPGTAAYYDSAAYVTASNWTEFSQALEHAEAPSENFVYADVDGDIGWLPRGLAPIRPNWDGLTPVPGDGRYEWAGFWPMEKLPSAFNPKAGFVGTANAMNLPDGYPNETMKLSFEWSDPTRANRINQVLAADTHVSVADSMALQTDDYSITDLRAVALTRDLAPDDPELAAALAALHGWNGHVSADSVGATIAEVWVNKHLGPATVAWAAPRAAPVIGQVSPDAVITDLEAHRTEASEVLLASLRSAVREISARLGPDMSKWSWGALHHATFVPAAAVLADAETRAAMTTGPLPLPGSATTPRAATYRMEDFNAIGGASVRLVMDVGDWDQSRAVNTPGQSGDPATPAYRDLFPTWAAGDYVPLLYSRAAVEGAARQIIHLMPGR